MSKVKSSEFIESSDDSDSDREVKKEKKERQKKEKAENSDDSDSDREAKKEKKEKPKKEKKAEKRKSKDVSDSDSDSDSDEEVKKPKKEKPAKKKPKQDTKLGSDENAQDGYVLGNLRKVSLMEFKGRKLINIREYYTDDSGDLKPGRKGIALSLDQWDKLLSVADKVNDAEGGDEESKEGWQLGKNRKVSLNEFRGRTLIDIREYYADANGDMRPGKKGISLNQEQWDKLMVVADNISDAL